MQEIKAVNRKSQRIKEKKERQKVKRKKNYFFCLFFVLSKKTLFTVITFWGKEKGFGGKKRF